MEKQYLEIMIIPNLRIRVKLEKIGFKKQPKLPVRIRNTSTDDFQIFRKEFDAKFHKFSPSDIDYRATFGSMNIWILPVIKDIFGNSVQLGTTEFGKKLIGKYYHFKFSDELYQKINI